MKKFIFLIFFLFNTNILTSIVKAEIVYIDINYVLNSSEVGKSLNKFINQINKKNTAEYKLIEDKLKNKEQNLIAQQNIIEKDEFEKQFNILSKEVQKYMSEKKSSIDKINNIKIENTKKILKYLNPIITKYVDDNSISLVIPKKNIIVGKNNLDITDQIIILLNDQVKSLEF